MKTIVLALAATALAATGAAAQTNTATAKPAMAAKAKPAMPATKTASANGGRMAQHTTKSGKTITYDCSKKGNMNKTACKK